MRSRTRMINRLVVIALLLACTGIGAAAPLEPQIDEYRVKAAFLYNFARFIEWPPEVFQDPGDPLTICVLGRDPFGRVLDDVVAGKKLDGRAFAVRRISDPIQSGVCRILFVSSSEPKRTWSGLAQARKPGVLIVGEGAGSRDGGAIFTFTLEGDHVRFEINTQAAELSNLRISSRLLSLARSAASTH